MASNKIISVEELWQFYNLPANLVCISGDSEYFNHINPTFAQLLNFTEEELVSTPYLDLIHPDDRESTCKEIDELRNGKPVTCFQNRHQMKSGDYKWLSWTANRSDADGNIYAIGLDCTDKMFETGFADSIIELIEEVMAMYPLTIKYSQSFSERNFNKKLKQAIIKSVKLQLDNIVKHAQATTVQINLEQINNKLFLSIEDNGVGFNKAKQKMGEGISNIIICAELYKGEVLIDAAPGKGCTLSVIFIKPM